MKLWGGRFAKDTDGLMDDFHSSISFDQRLYREDIEGSLAHAAMLAACGIITKADETAIKNGLIGILEDIESGKVAFEVSAEDIHMNIEKLLIERIGEAGKKLHTARSRNDQVAVDTRLYLKKEIGAVKSLLLDLQETLFALAAEHKETAMPGYTHMQKAQPITFGYHLLAYFQMFARDYSRFDDCLARMDVCPLGAGALAGTTFPIDRQMTAQMLGFARASSNAMDSVSDRDYAIEFCHAAALTMMHLSRFCEEVILWSTNEFAFITLDDAYSTGSSIMPQKKNPDVAELVRGKSGRVYGDLIALLTMMKGLPLAYNKDMQEDKEALFDAVDTLKGCLLIFKPMLATIRVHKDRMRACAAGGFINATDLADYLAAHGMPFREAHAVVGRIVLDCENHGRSLEELTMDEFHRYSSLFEEDVYQNIAIEACIKRRRSFGGPAPEAVEAALEEAKAWLQQAAQEQAK